METLYDRIIALCSAGGIRPGRLCSELGLSRGLISDLKAGRKKGVSAETAQKIASYFSVSVGYLLGQSESSEARPDASPDTLDQVDIAFYGDFKELSDEEKETVRDMVRIMRERRSGSRSE